MNLTKRILAGALAMATVLSCVACGNDGDTKTTTTAATLNSEDQAAIDDVVENIGDALPDVELANKTVKWLAHYDINPTTEGAVMPPNLALFETKYGGKIEWVQTNWESRFTDLANYVQSNTAPDLFPASDMDTHPKGAIKGMFQPIDDYVDLSLDIWEPTREACDKFMYQGKHYVAVIDVSPSCICIYNKNTIEEHGYDDPAELYAQGKWDWNTFEEMCIDFTDPDNDMYALDGWAVEKGIMLTAGKPLLDIVDGEVVSNVMDPTIEKVQTYMYELQKNGVLYPRHLINNWSIRGGSDGTGIGSGLQLFCPVGIWAIQNSLEQTEHFGNIAEGEVMFVPMPKDPDLDYYPIWSLVGGYNIITGAQNPEGAAAFINCCRFSADSEETNALGLKQLTEEYGWTEEMVAMKDEITRLARENPVFDFSASVTDDLGSRLDTLSRGTMIPGEQTWAELRGEQVDAIDYLVSEVNAGNV